MPMQTDIVCIWMGIMSAYTDVMSILGRYNVHADRYRMYLGGYKSWLYDNNFWKDASVFDAFEFFMRMARENTYYFKNFHKENPNQNSSQQAKNDCFSLYQLTTLWFSWHAFRDRSIRKTMGIKKNIFG